MNLNGNLKSADRNEVVSRNLRRPGSEQLKSQRSKFRYLLKLLPVTIGAFIFSVTTVVADSNAEANQKADSNFKFDSVRECVWDSDIGDGFRKHATQAGIAAGGGIGLRVFGGTKSHDIVLGAVDVGTMLSGPVAKDHWWCGNLELMGELFGGQQIKPKSAYLVGVSPILRYNFATGSRLVPFFGAGAGLSLTDIRHPDLSTDFEFNVQVHCGMHYFFKPNVAATFEARFLHLSNAGIDSPNEGVNTGVALVGVNWFF